MHTIFFIIQHGSHILFVAFAIAIAIELSWPYFQVLQHPLHHHNVASATNPTRIVVIYLEINKTYFLTLVGLAQLNVKQFSVLSAMLDFLEIAVSQPIEVRFNSYLFYQIMLDQTILDRNKFFSGPSFLSGPVFFRAIFF